MFRRACQICGRKTAFRWELAPGHGICLECALAMLQPAEPNEPAASPPKDRRLRCPHCSRASMKGTLAPVGYRAAASELQCGECGLAVLTGYPRQALAERLKSNVQIDARCLGCEERLSRVMLTGFGDRLAEVEHCPACALLYVEADEMDAVESLLGPR